MAESEEGASLFDGMSTDEAKSMVALISLEEGDLKPLAEFLRDGFNMTARLRHALVEAITGEGNATWRLKVYRPGKRGRPPGSIKRDYGDLEIGDFIAQQMDEKDIGVSAAVYLAVNEFGIEEGVAWVAWKSWKEFSEL